MQSSTATIQIGDVGGAIIESMRAHAPVIALILAYSVFGLLISTLVGRLDEAWPVLYVQFFLLKSLLLLLFYIFGRLLYAMLVVRPARLLEYVWRDFTANPVVHRQLASGMPLVIFVPLFLSVFASLKVLIPVLNPFSWDASFALWDRVVHGGVEPWRILQPIVGHPIITFAIDLLYRSWFYVLQLVCIWQAFSVKRPQLRMQFFLSFFLVWVVLGNLGATLLASAGPCFYDVAVGAAGPYQPLMDYLHQAGTQFSLWALEIQKMLWHGYLNPEVSITRGISAMPSIHVAMAFLMTLLGWQIRRGLGILLTAYLGVIMIGSVHLGWHYALDGYAGIAGTYAIWRLAGWVVGRQAILAGSEPQQA
jgi:hypothetical protein